MFTIFAEIAEGFGEEVDKKFVHETVYVRLEEVNSSSGQISNDDKPCELSIAFQS